MAALAVAASLDRALLSENISKISGSFRIWSSLVSRMVARVARNSGLELWNAMATRLVDFVGANLKTR
jgi:hypothetical protein